MDKELSCAALGPVDLERAKESAASSLSRQRQGLSSSEKDEATGAGGEDGLLTDEREGPATIGVPWDGNAATEKGLVLTPEGWKCVCEHDCEDNWSTSVLPAEHLPALVELYKLHVGQCHTKKKTSTEEDKFDQDKESYKEATKIRAIGAHADNRLETLSYVRFLPMPLQYQHIAKKQPAQQSPVWDRIDLSHCGLNLSDTSIIKKIHNRSYPGAKLNDFSQRNLGMSESEKDILLKPNQKGSLRQTKNVQHITTMDEAIGALMNFDIIWRFIHPLDYGSTAIVRFLMDKIHHPCGDRKMTSVRAVCGFFQAAFKGNADRVLGPHHPRTYQELVSFYNSMDWTGASASGESGNSKDHGSPFKQDKRMGSGKRSQSTTSDGENKRPRFELCYAFNSEGGCPRSKGDKCVKNGKTLVHLCGHLDSNGAVCGARNHGLKSHK